MLEEDKKEEMLSEIARKLSSISFVLHGCCLHYESLEFDTARLIELTKILHETSNELFELL